MPYKGGVQLLPESERRPTLRSYTSGNKYFYIAVVVAVIVLVISAILGGYKRSLNDQIDVAIAGLATEEKARNTTQEKELIAAAKQSKIMKELLEGKLYWTIALTRIEQMMQSSVQLVSIQANLGKGTIVFSAVTDSFSAVAKQLAAFSATTGISDFTIGKIEQMATGEIKFSGDLIIDKKTMFTKAKPSSSPLPRQSQ
jgi:hypothetical protein